MWSRCQPLYRSRIWLSDLSCNLLSKKVLNNWERLFLPASNSASLNSLKLNRRSFLPGLPTFSSVFHYSNWALEKFSNCAENWVLTTITVETGASQQEVLNFHFKYSIVTTVYVTQKREGMMQKICKENLLAFSPVFLFYCCRYVAVWRISLVDLAWMLWTLALSHENSNIFKKD